MSITSLKEKALRYYHSLQVRILVIFILVGMIPIFLMRYVVLDNYEKLEIAQKDRMIMSQCSQIVEQVSVSSYVHGRPSAVVEAELKQIASLYQGRALIVNSDFEIIRDTYGIDEDKSIISEEVLQCYLGKNTGNLYHYDKNSRFLEMTIQIPNKDSKKPEGVMIISVPTDDISAGKASLMRTVWMLQIALTILICAAAIYVSRILLRPFRKITSSLEGVQGGFQVSDQEISFPDYTETQLLADAYNDMLQRLRTQEDSRQEFVSNVSHELKTPLTSMKVLSDSLLAQKDVPSELYREFMGDIAEEIDRENKIISDLLSLVKMDRKAQDITIQEININQLIERILKRLRPIAGEKKVELVLDSFKPVIAEVDETKLTLALSNLIENGIKYNHKGGWVHVSLSVDAKHFFVKVEDSGIGISQADQEHIFERFYRADKSHSREIGGTGLGLAITRSAVLMHHGAIKVYSKENEGTTFTVRIPLKYAQ